jgi:hypothetical protein
MEPSSITSIYIIGGEEDGYGNHHEPERKGPKNKTRASLLDQYRNYYWRWLYLFVGWSKVAHDSIIRL